MIVEEYDESLFISRFEDYKRVSTLENPNGNFTYKGLRALFEYLDDLHDEENPLKLDVISLCCEFSEYKNLDEYLRDYGTEEQKNKLKEFKKARETAEKAEFNDLELEEDNFKQEVEEEINDQTTLIKFEDDLNEGFIIQNY